MTAKKTYYGIKDNSKWDLMQSWEGSQFGQGKIIKRNLTYKKLQELIKKYETIYLS